MFRALAASALVFATLFAATAIAASPFADIAYQAQRGAVIPAAPLDSASIPMWIEQLAALPEVSALAVPEPAKPEDAAFADVWERLRKNFAMPELTGPLVE